MSHDTQLINKIKMCFIVAVQHLLKKIMMTFYGTELIQWL